MDENIKELLQALLKATEKTSAKERYRALRFVLTRLSDIETSATPLQFSGLFAKINYLLTEKNAEQQLITAVGSARHRIRRLEETAEEELAKHFPYDLKSIIAFLQLLHPETEIPATLLALLPKGTLVKEWKRRAIDCLRVFVQEWDEHNITALADEEQSAELTIVYDSTNQYLQGDYSYLRSLLSHSTQLNLIRPRQEDGKLLPELIIFEPDFLVNITSIASGFAEYGLTPLTSLVKSLMPKEPKMRMLFGDFASQLLDEEVHGLYARPYSESIADFCRARAVDMATCKDLKSTIFHNDAKQQKENIHRAISEELPKSIEEYDAEKVVLEPSFICERLGLQGRMDFLQTDFRVLIEQKSGKAGFVPGHQDFYQPCPKTEHRVQLLLYRALLHYNYNVANEQIQPLLLYSKYTKPLYNTSSVPSLLHRAFALRNAIVWQELKGASEGYAFLETLTAEDLNKNKVNTTLWNDYTKKELEEVLQPLRSATPIEKAYHNVMLQFMQREYVLSRIGNKRKKNSGVCARWHDSLEEKKEAGNIIDNISITSDGEKVVCKNIDFSTSNFREGDVVTLYSYRQGEEPDSRKTIIHRATIEELDAQTITLRLRVPQTNMSLFDTAVGERWAMEHDFLNSSLGGARAEIHSFLSATPERKSLFLLNRKPEVDESRTLNGDYGSFNDLQLRVKQAKELFLLIGPPGSGKTSYGMLYTLKEELTEPDTSVAVMAYTNRAVDEVCEKLTEEGIDFVRIGPELSCSPQYRAQMLCNRVEGIKHIEDIRKFLCEQRVVVGTSASFNSHSSLFSLRRFTLAIVDEASQILEPQIIGLISAKHENENAIGKFVFIGDYKQLPAVVQQTAAEARITDPLLTAQGLTDCRMSLFERLLHQHGDDPAVTYTLRLQGRMHEDIARLSNELFYDGILSCVPLAHQTEESPTARVQFFNVPAPDDSPSDTLNIPEAEVIADIVKGLQSNMTVGIIVPYRNQISAIRQALSTIPDISERNITIDTVERFQGSQREVIIYGFTVQHPYQLDFLTENCFIEGDKLIDRKLNVVITRAMKYLFLVGNASLLERNLLFKKLISKYYLA